MDSFDGRGVVGSGVGSPCESSKIRVRPCGLIEDDEEESATTTLMAMLFVDCCFQYHPCIVSLYCIVLYCILS